MKENTDARTSKCWTCKHGLCISENETSKLYHGGSQEQSDIFDISSEYEESEEVKIVEHTVEETKVKAICYWRPPTIKNSPPILVAYIKQCNRHEARES